MIYPHPEDILITLIIFTPALAPDQGEEIAKSSKGIRERSGTRCSVKGNRARGRIPGRREGITDTSAYKELNLGFPMASMMY